MAKHLLLVHVGPVQELIAAARRTRDLWFGSWMLSTLSRAAAVAVKTHGGNTQLIFPPETLVNNADASVANKILAIIDAEPKTVSKEVRDAVRGKLDTIRTTARASFSGTIIDENVFTAQIDDLLEVYWVAVPLTDYPRDRRRVEALMAARKATRDFAPVTWGAMVPKSSIDGQRESVIDEERYPKQREDSAAERKTKVDELYKQYRAGSAERLSGVDLLKRHGKPANAALYFASTADIAVRPALARLRTHELTARAAWDTYFSAIRTLAAETIASETTDSETTDSAAPADEPPTAPQTATRRIADERVAASHWLLGRYDAGLLLESRLFELIEDRDNRKAASTALATFYQTAIHGNDKLARPEPYYAILLADGDRMGATIDAQTDATHHIVLSERLATFAMKVSQLSRDHNAALVYAGGDDVLAFVPLHTVLEYASALHTAFASAINPGEKSEYVDCAGKRPTLSVGIAICHQIESLSDALNLARAAEKTAKAIDGKDALAITLSKRSCADVTVAGHWEAIDKRLAGFTRMHRLDTLPDGAAFQLRDLAERLTPRTGDPTLPAAASIAEAKRILGRKQPHHAQDTQLATATLADIHAALEAHDGSPRDALATVRATADELIVARVLATAADHAGLALESQETSND